MEYLLVLEAFHLGANDLGINWIGNGFLSGFRALNLSFRSLSGGSTPLTNRRPVTLLKYLCLKRISAITEIFLKSRNAQGGDLGGRDGLANADLDRHSPLIGQLMDEPDGPEPRMDLSENMEKQGVCPVEIDGDNRQARILYKFENIVWPWFVLDDPPAADRRPPLLFLPGRYLACREEAKGSTRADMPESRADSRYAFRPSRREIIHGDEPFRKIRNLSQKKGGQDLEVRPPGVYYRIEDQPVSASERMVGNSQESAFRWDIGKLLGWDLVRYSEPSQDFLRELRALKISHIGIHLVEPPDAQDPVQSPGHALPHQAFQPQRLPQTIFAYQYFFAHSLK